MSHSATEEPRFALERATPEHEQSDADFLAAFESCTLSPDAFRHYEHVRLAWIYLGEAELDDATELMATAICRFALHHTGSTAKFNEALTRSWMRLVARARELSLDAPSFAAFAEVNPMLFDRRRAFDFYGVAAS